MANLNNLLGRMADRRGLSLTELAIAMAVGGLIFGGIYLVARYGSPG